MVHMKEKAKKLKKVKVVKDMSRGNEQEGYIMNNKIVGPKTKLKGKK